MVETEDIGLRHMAAREGQEDRGSYTMNNSLPPSAYMQRFNTSVDPWVRIEGNPYLVPMRIQTVRLNYDKSLFKNPS